MEAAPLRTPNADDFTFGTDLFGKGRFPHLRARRGLLPAVDTLTVPTLRSQAGDGYVILRR
jgi:hypothetical protein